MSSDQLQDDWEAAEVNMKALEIKDKPPAPRLLLKPPATGNAAGSGAPSPVQTDNPLDGPVDAALLNALTNPRERMVVFQIENNILNFMNSGERTMEIPPGYNSFRRLLAYRIGQRFGLSHTTSDQLSENGERGIVLYKTSATGFPSQLLIDMNTSCTPVDSDAAESDQPSPGLSSAVAAPRKMMVMKRNVNRNDQPTTRVAVRQAQSSEDKEKAYLEARARIFGESGTPDGSCSPGHTTPTSQAQEGGGDAGSGASSTNASLNLSKNSSRSSLAGEDATALPLGSAAGIANSSSAATAVSGKLGNINNNKKGAAHTAPVSVGAGVSGNKIGKSTSNSSLNSTGATAGSSAGGNSTGGNNSYNSSNNHSGSSSPSTEYRGNTNTNLNSNTNSAGNSGSANSNAGSGTGRRQLVDAGNWKGNKSQLRNVDAERSDPDFVRRSNLPPNNNVANNRSSQPVPQGRGNSNNMQGMLPNMQPTMQGNMQSVHSNMPPGAHYMDPMQVQMQMQYQMQLQLQMQQAMMGMPPVPPMNVPMPMQPGVHHMPPMQMPMQGHVPMQPSYMDPQQYQYMLQQQMMMQQHHQQTGYQQQHAQQNNQHGRPPVFNNSEFPPLG